MTRDAMIKLAQRVAGWHQGERSGRTSTAALINDLLAALRDRPAPPDDLVAKLRKRAQELALYAFREHGDDATLYNALADMGGVSPDGSGWLSTLDVGMTESLAAPAPVAAPAPETPAPVDVPACPDGQHSYRRNAPPQNGDVCFVCRKSIWWETPAPDAMPEIQAGDALTVEDDLGQRYEHRVETQADAKVPKGYKAVRLRRVIWRQEAQP